MSKIDAGAVVVHLGTRALVIDCLYTDMKTTIGAGQQQSSVCVALSLAVEQHVSQQRHLSGGHEERAARRSRHGQRAGSV